MIEPAKVQGFVFQVKDRGEIEIETMEKVFDPVAYVKRAFPEVRKREVICVWAY